MLYGQSPVGFGFFFQAEDGIRDGTVTGVQTCALPIWGCAQAHGRAPSPGAAGSVNEKAPKALQSIHKWPIDARGDPRPREELAAVCVAGERSEERRVGKECRSGWASCQEVRNVDL